MAPRRGRSGGCGSPRRCGRSEEGSRPGPYGTAPRCWPGHIRDRPGPPGARPPLGPGAGPKAPGSSPGRGGTLQERERGFGSGRTKTWQAGGDDGRSGGGPASGGARAHCGSFDVTRALARVSIRDPRLLRAPTRVPFLSSLRCPYRLLSGGGLSCPPSYPGLSWNFTPHPQSPAGDGHPPVTFDRAERGGPPCPPKASIGDFSDTSTRCRWDFRRPSRGWSLGCWSTSSRPRRRRWPSI